MAAAISAILVQEKELGVEGVVREKGTPGKTTTDHRVVYLNRVTSRCL